MSSSSSNVLQVHAWCSKDGEAITTIVSEVVLWRFVHTRRGVNNISQLRSGAASATLTTETYVDECA
jgi:hypothetical protein